MKRKLDVILEDVSEAANKLDEALDEIFNDLKLEYPGLCSEPIVICPYCRTENFPLDYDDGAEMECVLCGFLGTRGEFKSNET